MKLLAMIVLLCHTVIEHNYLNMTRWKDLRDDWCAFVIIEQKDRYISFSRISLHILLPKETAGYVYINLTPREVNSEHYFRFTAASFVNIFSLEVWNIVIDFTLHGPTHTHTHTFKDMERWV